MHHLHHALLLGLLIACGDKDAADDSGHDSGAGGVVDSLDTAEAVTTCEPTSDGVEHCDDVDEDCDGRIDEDAVNMGTWWSDSDGDEYGNPGVRFTGCNKPGATWVLNSGDCDDAEVEVFPGALELCDNLRDDDCDELVDNEDPDVDGRTAWWVDADYDGWGGGEPTWDCRPRDGLVLVGGDCDDSNRSVYPFAPEDLDGLDNDCDGGVDEGEP